MNTELIIIGAGASGMMAAVAAGEKGIKTLLLERKSKPGRKLLLCGNNRCNLSTSMSAEQCIRVYDPSVATFLRPAIEHFTPKTLQAWFRDHGLTTRTDARGRIYPASENADDVLHVFTDHIRQLRIPCIYNCPVHSIDSKGGVYTVNSESISLTAKYVIIATGGVSYPKTGSVGDGQKMARKLGHKLTPYRPGLAGFDMQEQWLGDYAGETLPYTKLDIVSNGKVIGTTCGAVVFNKWGLTGAAVVDASSLLARQNVKQYTFQIDLCPDIPSGKLDGLLQKSTSKTLQQLFAAWLPSGPFAKEFISRNTDYDPRMRVGSLDGQALAELKKHIKAWRLHPSKIRPLKEAMVTVGGVALDGIHQTTMESRKHPGLYFTGEVMDIDGPTGGFNLQAAFSTAQLCIHSIPVGGRH